MRVQALKDPRNDGHYIQHQGVLVTEPQATAQRSPVGSLTILDNSYRSNDLSEEQNTGPNEGRSVPRWVTFLLWVVLSARWKLAVKKKSRPTKRLLRVKTSATTDHCQLSLDTANSPPARTAPGPGPANLTVRRHWALKRGLNSSLVTLKSSHTAITEIHFGFILTW